MLPFPVFAKRIPRSPAVPFLSRMPVPQPLSPKFHGISIFADSHPLTRVASIFYRNMAGALLHPRAPRRLAEQGPRFFNVQTLRPCNVLPIYPLCFQILAHSSPQRVSHNSFHVNHFRTLFSSTKGVPLTLWTVRPHPLFHFFSFCTRQKLNPFIFNRFRTLCQKHGGVGRGLLLTSHLSSQSTLSLGGIPGSASTNSALTAAGACPDRVGALVPLLLCTDHGRLTVAHYLPSRTLLPTAHCRAIERSLLYHPPAQRSGTDIWMRAATQRGTMKRTFFRLLAFLLTAIAGRAQTQPPPLVSPELHSDNRVTFRFRGPNIKEVAVSIEGNPKPLPMRKDDQGVWSVTTDPLAPDYYGYSIIADGVSMFDPSYHAIKPNFLYRASELHVPGPSSLSWEIGAVPHG